MSVASHPQRHTRTSSEIGRMYAQISPRRWSVECSGSEGTRFCRRHVIVARRSAEEEELGGRGEGVETPY